MDRIYALSSLPWERATLTGEKAQPVIRRNPASVGIRTLNVLVPTYRVCQGESAVLGGGQSLC
jgi:hypothetical protein